MSWKAKQSLAAKLTWFLYFVAIGTTVLWFIVDCPRLEPLAVVFALLTAGLGSYFQFRISPMLYKGGVLSALVHELYKNMSIYREHYSEVPDKVPALLPPYHLSAVEACISVGVLDLLNDRELFNSLHDIDDRIRQINLALAVQQYQFQTSGPSAEIFERIVNGKAMTSVRDAMNELYQLVQADIYKELHEVRHEVRDDTVLFPDDDAAA